MRSPGAVRPPRLVDRAVWALEVFALLLVIWLGLNGFDRLVVGLLAATAGAFLAGALAAERPYGWRPHRLVVFALVFLLESLRGGIDVAWRAFHPALPIEPSFLRFRHDLPDGQPRTLMVSVLSLLPGTLSTDLVDDGRTLVVHVITAEAGASVERLRARIRWLFALPDVPR